MELTHILLIVAFIIATGHCILWHELNKRLEGVHPLIYHGRVIWPLRKRNLLTCIQDRLGYYYYWTLRRPNLSEWPYAIFIIALLLDIFM